MLVNFCPQCGHKAEDEYKFCPNCGLKLPREEESVAEPLTTPTKLSPPQTGQKTTRKRVYTAHSPKKEPSPAKGKIVDNEELATADTSNILQKTPPKRASKYISPRNIHMGKPIVDNQELAVCSKIPSPKGKGARLIKVEPLPEDEVLTDNSNTAWQLTKLFTHGNTGMFYEAYKTSASAKKEICILKLDAKDGKIFNEQNFFQRAAKKNTVDKWKRSHGQSFVGIPTCVGFGMHDKHRFLVFSALGENLQTMIDKNNLSEKTICQIVYRMVNALEYIHENEYVHGNITAENIFVNLNDLTEVYLAGYYFAFRYCPSGKHVTFKEGSRTPHEGTIEFISMDLHVGAAPSRRSDLESLGYCMMKWMSGSLPWSEATNVNDIMAQKRRCKTEAAGVLKPCFKRKKVPDVLKAYLEYVMCLNYEEKPDYDKLRAILSAGLDKMHAQPYDAVEF
ncbi:serine/threonine-protein kinase VRK3 [Pelodytes ibericus]